MKRSFTFLIAAMALMIAMMGSGATAWGQTYQELFTIKSDDVVTNSTYTNYETEVSGRDWIITFGGNNKSVGTNSGNRNKCNLGSYTKYAVSPVTTSNVASAFVNTTSISDVSKISYTFNGGSNQNSTIVYLIYSSDGTTFSQMALTSGAQGATISSGTAYTFAKCSGYFGLLFKATNSSGNWRIDDVNITFYKAGGPSCTIDPTSYDFGEITVGQSANHSFTVTTSNLTGDLTLTPSTGFTVSPTSIASTATSTDVTVTCTPTAVGALEGTLTISGGGLTEDVVATLSATGLCAAPATALAYTTPVALTLTGDDVSTTLVPTENTGNGGTITYELVAGDENHAIVDENTGEFTADAVGSYTVRATQALNGTTCGGTFDIVINVTGTNPTCTTDPTEWDFENVAVGTPIEKTFTVVTANLTSDLTLSMFDGTNFSVSPTTIEQSATSTQITVTCTATEAGELEDLLTISGGGLADDVDVELNATGYLAYTVTYSAVNGDAPAAAVVAQGSSITLGTVTNVDCSVWSFAGWSETEGSTTAPTLLAGTQYTPTSNITLYAVYARTTGSGTIDYTLAYDTWTYSGTTTDKSSYRLFGDGAYIESDEIPDLSKVTAVKITMRTFGGASYKNVNIEDASGNVWGNAVASGSTMAEITATKTNGLTGNGKLRIKSESGDGSNNGVGIEKVIYTIDNTSYAYSTNPSCAELVATPTISPNGGIFFGSVEISLNCETDGATISYTTDNWETTNTYNEPFTITETATVKAKANKSGMNESYEASATFTKTPRLETIQEIFNAATTQEVQHYVLFNDYVVSGVSGANAYVTNGTQGFIIYKYSHEFAEGDILNGTIQAKLKSYNGSAEFTDITASTTGLTVTHDGTITPQTASISDLGGINTGAPIIVNNVTYNSSTQTLKDASDNGIKPITTLYSYSFENGQKYNATGIYLQYNDTKEIMPRKAEDIQLIVDTPTFDPAGGDYNAAQTVTIASATPNATIYYTLDGTDPTSESSEYSTPLEIGETTTIKAFAVKEGVSSGISTATYTITITTVATPTITESQYFNENIEVTLDCATDGATIVYTTDNWGTSTTYTEPFTLTETTTVKAKATKSGMDDSEVAEATYTKRYKVSYAVNGDGTLFEAAYVTPTEAIGTLPTPTAANIPNGYVFRGWSANDVDLTNTEPAYVLATDVPTGNMNLKAVFAIQSTDGVNTIVKMQSTDVLNNGDKIIIVATVEENDEEKEYAMYQETVSTSYVNKYEFDHNIETVLSDDKNWLTVTAVEDGFKLGDATNGYIYNSSNNLYCGTTEQVWTIQYNGENEAFRFASGGRYLSYRYDLSNKYWRMGGSSYGTSGMVNVDVYKISTGTTVYSNFCTSVNPISGDLSVATTIANTAYYISDEAYVPTNETATINGALGNADASLLVINDGAQLIHSNAGLQATVKKNITGYGEGEGNYYFIAAPMASAVSTSGIATGTYDLYAYDEVQALWLNAKQEGSTFNTLNPQQGYLYANNATQEVSMAGTLNPSNEAMSYNLSFARATDDFKGFNLVGNPFACNASVNGSNSNAFYKMNEDGTEVEAVINPVVAPCTGIFALATDESQTVTFTKNTTGEPNVTRGLLTIAISKAEGRANKQVDRAIVSFDEISALPKFNINAGNSKLYIPQGNKNFAVVNAEAEGTLPLCFEANQRGNYTISVSTENLNVEYLHLIDNMTGADIDLLVEESYSFSSKTTDYASRFKLVFKANAQNDEMNEVESSFAYISNGELIVSNEGRATLQVIDMMGRVLRSQTINGDCRISVNGMTAGVYVLNLNGKTQKIVVR